MDSTGAPFEVVQLKAEAQNKHGNNEEVHSLSDEFQVSGEIANLKFVSGLYYQWYKNRGIYGLTLFDLTPALAPVVINYNADTINTSKAIYAQGTYDLSSITGINGLSVLGGARYTWEKISQAHLPGSLYYGLVDKEKVSFDDLSWQFGLQYQATDGLLLYADARRSWRNGGMNSNNRPIKAFADEGGNLFRPETAKAYEAGIKFRGNVTGAPVRINLALYNQTITNVQRSIYANIDGILTVLVPNIPQARIRGVEVDGSIAIASWLDVGGSMAFTDAKYTKNAVSLFGVDYRFGPYSDTPKWSGTGYITTTLASKPEVGTVKFRAELYAQTAQYFSNLDDTLNPGTRLPGYALVNLRFDWEEFLGSNFSFGAFVKNVTNKGYYTGGLNEGAAAGFNSAALGTPRMFGLKGNYKF